MELLNKIDQALDSITGITDAVGIYSLNWNGCQTLSYQVNFTSAAATTKTFDSGKSEVTTFTFPSKAGSTGGDYGVVFDSTGLGWAFALNKSGADPAPTGVVWAAIPAGRKTNVDISSATTAAQVAALVETAFDALTANPFTTDDSAADGTMIFTCVIRGNTTNAQVHNANDSGVGSITFVVTTAGVASEVTVGASEITTFTFPTKAGSTGGDYGVVYDTAGLAWAFALNKSGSDPEPTGAIWAAIATARKTNVDISGATTAAQVAALVETAFDALVSVPFTTDDSAANGTMIFTCTLLGSTTNAERHNANDSGNGSLSFVTTTQGAFTTFAVPTHGYSVGRKGQLTTTGTLPAGLATGTDYFLIPVDTNTVMFASTLANSLATIPIPVNVTGQGTDAAVNTFTPVAIAGATAKLQKSNGRDAAGTEMWSDEIAVTGQDLVSATITATATFAITKVDPTGKNYRLLMAITAGELTVSGRAIGKGPQG